jgi:hypothetical protein
VTGPHASTGCGDITTSTMTQQAEKIIIKASPVWLGARHPPGHPI